MKEYSPQEDEDAYLDEVDEEKLSISKVLIALFIGIFAVGGLGLMGFVFFQGKTMSVDDAPLIKADKNPAKVKPEEPGGMVVANMDKTVYDNISGSPDTLQKTEKILPAPEEPIDKIQVITGQHKEEAAAQANEKLDMALLEDTTEEIKTGTTPAADTEIKPAPAIVHNETAPAHAMPKESPVIEAMPVLKKANPMVLSDAVKQSSGDAVRPLTESDLKLVPDSHSQKQPEIHTQQSASAEGYKVQLAAFKSEKDAVTSWKKIQRVHMDLLGNLQYYIERKEVEGKGTFYRLQAGVITKESEARLLCKKLLEVKQGCFVAE